MHSSVTPIFVDLDGTLVATDLLHESLLLLTERSVVDLGRAALAVMHGRHRLKAELADRVMPSAATLPYREQLVEFLREEHGKGRPIILATASHSRIAAAIAEHLGIFSHVLATDGEVNLKGIRKLEAIRSYCGSQGWDRFAYAGDSEADLPIFGDACETYLVTCSRRFESRVRKVAQAVRVFPVQRVDGRKMLRLMRPHQWVKNVLVLVPVVVGDRWNDGAAWALAITGLIAFCLVSSAAYVINDLIDIRADRNHESKRSRPLATGVVSITQAMVLAPLLWLAGFVVSFGVLGWPFGVALLVYFATTLAYTFVLKKRLMVDVITLAFLYTLRIIAGCLTIGVVLSPWLLTFSAFTFTSLALVKRFTELRLVEGLGTLSIERRGYHLTDLVIIPAAGISSAYAACLTLALYINSDAVRETHRRPEALWLLLPLLIYWMTRVWFLAGRNELHHDPIVFAIRDRNSQVVAVLASIIVILTVV